MSPFIEKILMLLKKLAEALGLGLPIALITGIRIPFISLKQIKLAVDVLVVNRCFIPLRLAGIDYLVEIGGRTVGSGSVSEARTIRPHGSDTITVPVVLSYDDIIKTTSEEETQIKPGAGIAYKIKVTVGIRIPIFGRLTVPLEKDGEIPLPHAPLVDLEKVSFERFSVEETAAVLHLRLVNWNSFDLGTIRSLGCEVRLSGASIGGAELGQAAAGAGKKGGSCLLELPVTFRPKELGSAVWDVMQGGGASYSLKGSVDVDTAFGAMAFPVAKEGGITQFLKKHEVQ